MKRVRKAAAGIVAGLIAAVLMPGSANADEVRDGQWYLDTLGIHEAHELSQGAGVTIGVIDTGVNPEHPDLEGRVVDGTDLVRAGGDGFADLHDHGTGVVSVLAGNNDANGVLGIAPQAEIVSVNVFPEEGPVAKEGATSDAIKWLADYGVDIISMSLGGGGGAGGVTAVRYAHDRGIPVVVGVGNKHTDIGYGPQEQVGSGWGSVARTIPVTGINQDHDFWEDSLDLSGAARQPELGLAAPAVDMPVATGGGNYNTTDGTSYATPIVAGTLALIKSAYPDLDYQTMIARLIETVDDKGPEGYDYEYGWGIVNPLAALTEDVVFEDDYSSIESYADDRLPLEEQGQQTGDDGNAPGDNSDDSAQNGDDQPLVAASNAIPTWAWTTIAATAVLAAAVITTLLIRRRNQGISASTTYGAPDTSQTSQSMPMPTEALSNSLRRPSTPPNMQDRPPQH